MENKHMKRCSTSLLIMEIHIKIILRYHYRPSRMATTPGYHIAIPSAGEDEEKFIYIYSHTLLVGM